MKTVVVTDAMYRSAVTAVRLLGRCGWRVVVTQTRGDCSVTPPAFVSRYAAQSRWISGSVSDAEYSDALFQLLGEYSRPVLLCVGAATLNAVSWQRERFRTVCDFLISPPHTLDALNDKDMVYRRCVELNLPVPRRYEGPPERYPVIVKPRCGERFGLKARDRYMIARTVAEYRKAMSVMSAYDDAPLVQEKLDGEGAGVSMLIGPDKKLLEVFCHRRIREYPISGGPSSCCESFFDRRLIHRARRLLHSFDFTGLAMVEFKAGRILEVNPRIWGSFPLVDKADSPIVERYALAAAGEWASISSASMTVPDFRTGVRMRFLLNDAAAVGDLLLHGNVRGFASGVRDFFTTKEALSDRDDPAPMRCYLRNTLFHR